jgi:NADH-quinone oxidoreductase subunit D
MEQMAPKPELKTEELVLNMGPQHPSTHGVLRLELVTDGEFVVECKPHIGYLHRCFEKHVENVPYNEVLPYTDRMDYLASFAMNMGFAVGIEKMMDIEVNRRVETIRVIMLELQRIASHLVAFGTFGLDLGAITPFLWAFREREKLIDLFEIVCGARLLYNYIWVGGLSHDITTEFIEKAKEFCTTFDAHLDEYNSLLTHNQIFIDRTAGIGVLTPEVAISYGVTGPNLRASGVKWDLRKNAPYSIYSELDFEIPVGTGEKGVVGDTWDRYYVRMLEMEQSNRIVSSLLDNIPEGDVKEAVPRMVKPKAGEIYSRTESPRGEIGYYIVADGKKNPFRIKVRSPAFTALSVMPVLCKGVMISDVIAILGSIDIVLGEIDR